LSVDYAAQDITKAVIRNAL